MNCLVCGQNLKREIKEDETPICGKKKCIKEFVRIFGGICHGVDEECGMETDGFLMGKQLIRYGHFDEDFEKAWKKREKREPTKK